MGDERAVPVRAALKVRVTDSPWNDRFSSFVFVSVRGAWEGTLATGPMNRDVMRLEGMER